MKRYFTSEKSVTRTFRISAEWNKVLEEEGERQGISVSALMNRIMRRYAHAQRWSDRYGSMTIAPRTVIQLVEKIPDEEIEKVGETSGAVIPKEWLLMMGLPPTFETVMWLMTEIHDAYNRWFQCNHLNTSSGHAFFMRHGLGRKWSIFLNGYITAMLRSLLNIEARTEVHDDSIIVYVKKEKTTS